MPTPVSDTCRISCVPSCSKCTLSVPPAGVTADIADGILASKDVDIGILNAIKGLFRKCDEARFAMSPVSGRSLKDDLESLEEIIIYFERKRIR